ncbi:unnamed protein product [Sphagnum jensenii]
MVTRGGGRRGGGEKSKEVDGAKDIGSPDRRDPIAASNHQESPLFKYLCNLSPIKPLKAVHVAHTYNELTFPPEPRIFASPRSTQRASSSSLKRVVVSEREIKSQFANIRQVVKASPQDAAVPKFEKVAEFNEDHSARLWMYEEQAEASLRAKFLQDFPPEMVDSVSVVINDQVSESCDGGLKRSSALDSGYHDHHLSVRHGGEAELDQHTTAMAYLLAGDQDFEPQDREDDWSEDSLEGSRVSACRTSEYPKALKDDFCEDVNVDMNTQLANEGSVLQDQSMVLSHTHRGFRRRCLDFDTSVARGKNLDIGRRSLRRRQSAPVCRTQDLSKCEGGNHTFNESSNQGCNPLVMPSGIGLHLNSLTSSISFKRDFHSTRVGNSEGTLASILGVEPLKSASLKGDQSDVCAQVGMGNEGPPVIASQSFGSGVASSSQRSQTGKQRKSTVASGDKSGEGCKRCNCKKSKCLKLYCECFAAGIYCVGSCACRECLNKPEFEETVLNTRQQIESRNPLAFAPKIVQAAETSPTPGEDSMDTPASARHKRGCNCKKSLCLKKYCECYQAGVGCSEGCRCEGCKNMYGRKEGSREEEEKDGNQVFTMQEEPQADDPIELLNRMSGKSEQFRSSGNKNISPITPSFENDGMGLRSASRKRAPHDEHCSSPLLHQAGSRPSKFPTWFSNTLDGFQLAAYSQGAMELSMSGGGESPMTTMNLSRIGHLSPQWEGLADICTLTPLPMAPPRPTPTSVTTLDRSGFSPCFSSQLIDPSCNGGSSATRHNHSLGKLLRRSPPRFRQPAARSPLNFKTQQDRCNQNQSLASTHLSQEHSQGGKHNALSINSSGEDDDIHDSLRCPEVASPLQTTITKSGSPNQKRVNPPRQGGSLEQGPSKAGGGMVMSSSPGLRSSCKFTLQKCNTTSYISP